MISSCSYFMNYDTIHFKFIGKLWNIFLIYVLHLELYLRLYCLIMYTVIQIPFVKDCFQ